MESRGTPAVNVMIAESDEEIRTMLSEFLKREGYTVTAFPDPRALETALGAGTPDFILLHVGEEGRDGLKTLERIRSDPDFDAVPVVMLSGEQDADVSSCCARGGADGVFTWPYSAEHLAENIRALLAGESVPLVIPPE